MKESHWIKRCGENIAKHLFIAVLCIGIIAISLTCMTRFGLLISLEKGASIHHLC